MSSNVCEYCGKAFTRLPSVYRHIREVHKLNCTLKELNPENIDKFPCRKSNKCKETFSSAISRYRHEKKIHERRDVQEEFICYVCNLSCRTRLNIIQHLKSDHPTTIQRPNCDYDYGGDLRRILITDGVQISLPDEYIYEIVKWKQSSSRGDNFIVDFLLRAATEEAIKTDWIERLQEKNKIFFRKVTVRRSKDENVIFKKRFCCGRNVHIRNKKKSNPKHTNCPFYIFVRIFKKDSSSKFGYTAKIRIAHKHNHTIESAESMKFRPVSKSVEEKIINLFHNGSGPSEAYRQHILDLKTQYGDDFYKIQQDRYSCPHKRWFYQLHEKIFKKGFTSRTKIDNKIGESLPKSISKYDSEVREILESDSATVASFQNSIICDDISIGAEVNLELEEATETEFTDDRIDHTYQTTPGWHDKWRMLNSGPQTGAETVEKSREEEQVIEENPPAEATDEDPHIYKELLVVRVTRLLQDKLSSIPFNRDDLLNFETNLEEIVTEEQLASFLGDSGSSSSPLRKKSEPDCEVQPTSICHQRGRR